MELCDRQLRRWYREANARWFGGRLPDDIDLLLAPHEGCSGVTWQGDADSFIILINPAYALDKRVVKLVLLHEMAHVALWPYKKHGRLFEEEMLRLAKAGAMKNLW
jgi:hypothetical protein